ncbi:MAG: hypothetical protein HY244_19720 [Rhizobiales bacterium]|nr:hypothetical protein [Hyphomicrobiales bacterium]
MKTSQLKMAFGAAMILGLAATGAIAQTAEPTFKGDPSVYKVIFEDANFRVIEANRPAGVKDKPHGHPLPSIIYNVNDCKSTLTGADGKTRESITKAGTAAAVPIIGSHTAENIGTAACKQVFVEKK